MDADLSKALDWYRDTCQPRSTQVALSCSSVDFHGVQTISSHSENRATGHRWQRPARFTYRRGDTLTDVFYVVRDNEVVVVERVSWCARLRALGSVVPPPNKSLHRTRNSAFPLISGPIWRHTWCGLGVAGQHCREPVNSHPLGSHDESVQLRVLDPRIS